MSRSITIPFARTISAFGSMSSPYRKQLNNEEVTGWTFHATLREQLNFARYPLGRHQIKLRMWHPDYKRSFTEDEIAFMNAQPLARIATVNADGQPDVVPVGFEFDGTHINIGGYQPATTRRHHNILDGNNKVLVIDDLVSTQPWTPRYLRGYGTAEVVDGSQPYLRVTPEISWSWNLGGRPFSHDESFTPPKRTVHQTVTS